MAWTTPRTYTTGELMTAAIMNAHVRDNLDYLKTAVEAVSRGNLLVDGDIDLWTDGTSFTAATTPVNSDDTYLADHWLLLSDGNDIVDVTQQTASPPTGSHSFHRADVQTANEKFAFATFIEAKDAVKLQGATVSLSFQAKTTAAAVENVRAAVLSWDGGADAITSDVVSSWAVEGTNPTWAANWTAENTATNNTLTTSWQTFEIEDISLDTSGIQNIAVVIWVDDTDCGVNDILDLAQVRLEKGAVATSYLFEDIAEIKARGQRYYMRWDYDAADLTMLHYDYAAGAAQGVGTSHMFPVDMRTTPSMTKSGTWGVGAGCGQPSAAYPYTGGFCLYALTGGAGQSSFYMNNAGDYISANARL